MTDERRKQIEEAFYKILQTNYLPYCGIQPEERMLNEGFIIGAEWADANPRYELSPEDELDHALAAASIHAEEHRKCRDKCHDLETRIEKLREALQWIEDKKTDTNGAHSYRAIITARKALLDDLK